VTGPQGTASSLFWRLPYGVRRGAARLAFPRRYATLQRLRSLETEGPLTPFFRHRCLFILVSKAAGLSVGKALFGGVTGHHRSIAGYQLLLSRSEVASFFKFAFVRNPWDRLASAFFFLKGGGLHDADARWAAQHLTPYATFEAFVTGWVSRRNVLSWVHFRPQHHYLCLPGQRETPLDFVGFFENLASDYELIRRCLGTGAPLKAENVTRTRRDYRTLYTPEMRQIVADVYREDIALLGYTFDNSSLQQQLARRPVLS
jgi:hypothetical protein